MSKGQRSSPDQFDMNKRYVRVNKIRNNELVEFDFSIGDPSLFVELILPFSQFKKFCKTHNTQDLTEEQQAQVDLESLKWRFGEPDSSLMKK